MSEPLFDPEARAHRRARALQRTAVPFLAERIVDDIIDRLQLVRRSFAHGLVTGCPPALQERFAAAAREVEFAPSIDHLAQVPEASLDLLIVIGELDTRDELPALLGVARSRLSPGGLLTGALPGGQSLPALRQALHAADALLGRFPPRTHPRVEASALAGLLGAAGLVEPVVDVDRVKLRYRSLFKLVSDLRDHAATNVLVARTRAGLSRNAARAAESAFLGMGEEQIELLHFAAWAPPGHA